jgi:hypothetical protein
MPSSSNHEQETEIYIAFRIPASDAFKRPHYTLSVSPRALFAAMVTLGLAALVAASVFVYKPPATKALDNGVGRLPCETVPEYPIMGLSNSFLLQLWDTIVRLLLSLQRKFMNPV